MCHGLVQTLYFLNFVQTKSKDRLGGSNWDLAVFPEFSYIKHQGKTMKLTILAPTLALDFWKNCIIHHHFPQTYQICLLLIILLFLRHQKRLKKNKNQIRWESKYFSISRLKPNCWKWCLDIKYWIMAIYTDIHYEIFKKII